MEKAAAILLDPPKAEPFKVVLADLRRDFAPAARKGYAAMVNVYEDASSFY